MCGFLCTKKELIVLRPWHYASLVFLGGCSFGILSTIVKSAYGAGFGLAEVSGSQFLFGALILWLAVLFSKRKHLEKKRILQLIVSGIPMGVTGIVYYQSLQTLDASLAIIFLFQFVWIGTLLEWLIDKKKPTRAKIISIAILVVGSILGAGVLSQGTTNISWQGALWGMLAACSFSSFVYISGSVGREIPAISKEYTSSNRWLALCFSRFPSCISTEY